MSSEPSTAAAWMEVLDETTQRKFWFNPVSGESTWTSPHHHDMEEIAHAWELKFDDATQRQFYWNSITQESSWERPETKAATPPHSPSNQLQKIGAKGDWEIYQDPQTNRNFYYNTFNGKSQWDVPEGLESYTPPAAAATARTGIESSSSPSPEEQWIEMEDPATKRVYWYNQHTGESQWTKPAVETAPSPRGAGAANNQATPQEEQIGNWVKMEDPQSGRMFYYNKLDGRSQWELPAELCIDPVVSSAASVSNKSVSPASASGMAGMAASPDPDVVDRALNVAEDGEESTWEVLSDPNTKRVFFYNRKDGRSQWERPDDLMPTKEMQRRSIRMHYDAKSNWEALRDPDTQQVFYYNRDTGTSQWECPEELENVEALAAPSQPMLRRSVQVHFDAESQWERMKDPKSMKLFYHNVKTGHMQWDVPSDMILPDDDEEKLKQKGKTPNVWREVVDPVTKRSFFYNKLTGESRWLQPEDAVTVPKKENRSRSTSMSDLNASIPGLKQFADQVNGTAAMMAPIDETKEAAVPMNTAPPPPPTSEPPSVATTGVSTGSGPDAPMTSGEPAKENDELTEADWLIKWRKSNCLNRFQHWEQMEDPETKQVFYFSTTTSLGQTDAPDAFEEYLKQKKEEHELEQVGKQTQDQASSSNSGVHDVQSAVGGAPSVSDGNNVYQPTDQGSLPPGDATSLHGSDFHSASRRSSALSAASKLRGLSVDQQSVSNKSSATSNLEMSNSARGLPASLASTQRLMESKADTSMSMLWQNLKAGFVDPTQPTGTTPSGPGLEQRTPHKLMAFCLRSYAATEEGELSFAQGDTITVTEKNEHSRWWVGELDGVRGRFLPSHVRLLSKQNNPSMFAKNAQLNGVMRPGSADSEAASVSSLTAVDSHSQARTTKAQMNEFNKRMERKQVETKLALALRQVGVEPMKALDSYPTNKRLASLARELQAMNARNHNLKVEVRGLQWAIHLREKAIAAGEDVGSKPPVDLKVLPNIPVDVLQRYGDLIDAIRYNPQLLGRIGTQLNIEAQFIYAVTLACSLFDQYSQDFRPFLDVVQAVIDVETAEEEDELEYLGGNIGKQPFLPSLLAAYAQRTECQQFLRGVFEPVKEEVTSILADTRGGNIWGDMHPGGPRNPTAILPDAALQIVQTLFESLASEATQAAIPKSMLSLCFTLSQAGGDIAVREFIVEVVLLPAISDLKFFFGQDDASLKFDPTIEGILHGRVAQLCDAMRLAVAHDGGHAARGSQTNSLRIRASVALLNAFVDQVLNGNSLSSTMEAAPRPGQLTNLVVMSCFDVYMLHLAIDYYRARPNASGIPPQVASILADFGGAKPLHTGVTGNPYVVIEMYGMDAQQLGYGGHHVSSPTTRRSAGGRPLLGGSPTSLTTLNQSTMYPFPPSPVSLEASSELVQQGHGGLSDSLYQLLVKARARLDSLSNKVNSDIAETVAFENEQILNTINSFQGVIRHAFEEQARMLQGVAMMQSFYNELLVQKDRLVKSQSAGTIQFNPRLNDRNESVRKFKSVVGSKGAQTLRQHRELANGGRAPGGMQPPRDRVNLGNRAAGDGLQHRQHHPRSSLSGQHQSYAEAGSRRSSGYAAPPFANDVASSGMGSPMSSASQATTATTPLATLLSTVFNPLKLAESDGAM